MLTLPSTKLPKSNAVPLHLQTLGLENELFSQISHRDSPLSLKPSDQIYKHSSDYISHSYHGSVWVTAHNCPKRGSICRNRPQLPTITHFHVFRMWSHAPRTVATAINRSRLLPTDLGQSLLVCTAPTQCWAHGAAPILAPCGSFEAPQLHLSRVPSLASVRVASMPYLDAACTLFES